MNTGISIENLSKCYHLGQINTGTLANDLKVWWAKRMGNPNPFRKVGELDLGNRDGEIIWALKDINIQIMQGDVLGIIGRNGAGKSTLLKILSQVTAPTSGCVKVKGRIASLLEVGTGFHPDLTGRENIYLNGTILGMKKKEIDRKFDEIVAFAEISEFIHTPVKRYSSGMYVRLAFAVAAHLEPEILIVDEVLAVGDVAFQRKCLGKMNDVAKKGRTILFVSHNLPSVKSLCSRAIILDRGFKVFEGETSEAIQKYLGEDQEEVAFRSWPQNERPGNDSFKISAVRLLDINGKETAGVEISEGAKVEIEFEVIQPGSQVGLTVSIIDGDGAYVFASLNNHERKYYGKPMACGHYKSICTIYGNLLGPGKYSIFLYGYCAHWRDGFGVQQTLVFRANDDGVLRGDYFHPTYVGAVRPKLEWATQFINKREG